MEDYRIKRQNYFFANSIDHFEIHLVQYLPFALFPLFPLALLAFSLACGLWLVPVNAALCVAGLSLLMNPK